MDLYKELVNGLGYAVCPIENMRLFKKLRDSFVDKMNMPTESDKNINVVRKAIAKMSNSEILFKKVHAFLVSTNKFFFSLSCCLQEQF